MLNLPKPPVTKTKKPSWKTIAKLYKEGLLQVFGDPENPDEYLVKALKRDVHKGSEAPGQWSPHSILEIYCEGGIPNATDINEFPPMPEFGFAGGCSYNSDQWAKVDQYVNQTLALQGYAEQVYHEPYNNAVVNIGWS
ncbi:MAG: hypothetical protein CMM76_13625 [Rhodospirillaceae bacterium]|nr:hypothetical protein [Rhodospirillaceae bacterium]